MFEIIEDRLLRSPYLLPQHDDRKPLTVLFSLWSRSLRTPTIGRPKYANSSSINQADHAGEVADSWGAYWRKVHGPSFVHIDETGGQSMDHLLKFEQLHRFAPGPARMAAPPYNVCLDRRGRVWPTTSLNQPTQERPYWAGASYLSFKGIEDIAAVFGNGRVRQRALTDDLDVFGDVAPILSKQYIIIPTVTGNESICLVKLHVRAQHLGREEFQSEWLHQHAELVVGCRSPLIKRYVQLHNIGATTSGQPFFHLDACWIDGVTLMSFTSLNDLEDYFRSENHAAISRSEARITDIGASEWWTALSIGLVDRISPEKATDLESE